MYLPAFLNIHNFYKRWVKKGEHVCAKGPAFDHRLTSVGPRVSIDTSGVCAVHTGLVLFAIQSSKCLYLEILHPHSSLEYSHPPLLTSPPPHPPQIPHPSIQPW